MGRYSQSSRPMAIRTPLGTDAFLLTRLAGSEAISEPFRFTLDLLAEQPADFGKVLGQPATVTLALPNGSGRSIHGIVSRLIQADPVTAENGPDLIHYRAELVPALWLLGCRFQSRIFQQLSVSDILRRVLHDDWRLDVTFKLTGTYLPRNYCVQYRETDLAFVSRLMEEEGISYFFQHTNDGHTMILADQESAFPELPRFATVNYERDVGGPRPEPRILAWEKDLAVRSCKHTLWDHTFQMPANNLEARQDVPAQAAVGQVEHRLGFPHVVNGVNMLETFDYPGGYAWRRDGVSKEGMDQPQDLQDLTRDNDRTASLRAQREAAAAVTIRGRGDCGHFTPGYRFTLARHFDGNGPYLLSRVEHQASLEGAYITGGEPTWTYENRFECVPGALQYRPARATPQPRIDGPQTAVVVGPPGQEIFLDKYGRVKVQFRWDRQGQHDASSSCWVRVAQFWAGKTWGAFFWPRIGHEVIVAFEEGDPDRPLIIGSVYNDANLPPLKLPGSAMLTGIKSCIYQSNQQNSNSVIFHDTPGVEYVHIHSEKHDMHHSKSTQIQYVANGQFRIHGGLRG